METKRFNTFYLIHKALRAMMYDCAVSIQQTDFTNKAEVNLTVTKIRNVIENFDDHANHEDNFLMPMIVKYKPVIVAEFENEHVTDHRLGKEISGVIDDLNSAATDDERKSCGLKLLYLFNDFMGFNLYHMNKEEDILNNILWKHYTDEEILAMQGRLISSIPPEKNMISVTWMMKSISNNEIIQFLSFQKKIQPEEIYKGLLALAENQVAKERWDLIKSAINA